MNTDDFTKWLSLGANLAVLAGIILPVVELNQNNEVMRAQMRNEITQSELNFPGRAAESRDLSDVIVRANTVNGLPRQSR